MTVNRMANVGIVVEDMDAAIEFFSELVDVMAEAIPPKGAKNYTERGYLIAGPAIPAPKPKQSRAGSGILPIHPC